ncbi:MAG: hypothetical protein KAG98_05025 [Lentisphaeria bacterium]|nr:hypothetical protein [Lentisphaeria bacterium]
MSENKETIKKLESVNRQNKQNDDNAVRKSVVVQRKKELARTVSDLDDMLQGLHAGNDSRIKLYKVEAQEEEVLQGVLEKLQIQVKELLATNPELCTDNQMASLAAKIESTRRAILRIQLGGNTKKESGTIGNQTKGESFLLLSNWQKFKLALILSLPVIMTLTFGFLLIALVLGLIFGV